MIAQNGPGITNFVTPVKTAYWNHTPLLLVTPQVRHVLNSHVLNKCQTVSQVLSLRQPTRPLAKVDSKKWSRWRCSRIAFATKRRRESFEDGWCDDGFLSCFFPAGQGPHAHLRGVEPCDREGELE